MNHQGCPGSRIIDRSRESATNGGDGATTEVPSQLRQWPVQMHLVSPSAPYFQGADVLLSADCVAFALGSFHSDHLKGKALGIACPKLDNGQDVYVDKIKALIDEAKINTLTVMIMQVPCCRGLLATAVESAKQAERKIPIKLQVVGLEGEILQDEWVDVA